MAVPRSKVVRSGEIGVYHCVSRCVRRAFLCGYDSYTGRDYGHRRGWVRQRVRDLSRNFAVDVFAYAIMSNHSHLVLRNRPDLAAQWSLREVAERWCRVFPGAHREGEKGWEIRVEDLLRDRAALEKRRRRLADVSWYMRCLNEWIARRANGEDKCTGRFWEGRFRCQALVDEGAVLACMIYVDLNPVRAALATGLEDSWFTSVYDRLRAARASHRLAAMDRKGGADTTGKWQSVEEERRAVREAEWLEPLGQTECPALQLDLEHYLNLAEWTAGVLPGNPAAFPCESVESLLDRFQLDAERWAENVASYGSLFHCLVGSGERMVREARRRGRSWFRGRRASARLYGRAPTG